MKTILNKNILSYILILLILASCSSKQAIPVWEVTKKDCPTSYIIGITNYLSKNADGDLISDTILKYFDSAEIIISQIDERNSDIKLIINEIGIGQNLTLADILSPKELESLKNKKNTFDGIKKNNFSSPDSSKVKLIFYLKDILNTVKKDYLYFDMLWQKRAMASHKEKIGLESSQEFYGTQAKIPLSEQIDFMNSISDFNDFSTSFSHQISSLYLDGNLEEIQIQYLNNFPYLKTNYNSFFTKKHEIWATKLDANLSKQKCFISLDVIHLVGKNNLIKNLLSKGYSISKIK